ncbi:signal peptidase I [Candidatus Kaiserbacteria bacterium CG10_big_fil_rev_8_21_14_0_10_49_17]|uniref:Signal peptidase I n=1 Tax=Candidatus Kaiserbacteria bacterium CG10_big_fil_rev_8_21_14_0_10_49_17 TaxID=1974609 RepID=A0A2M6WDM7_9BACT|nr:MAG: signal peptidase I [Candidatus Kaiserbacteria bacterium CG10_big_fil_rev_8_21_14_0_10_49_17]
MRHFKYNSSNMDTPIERNENFFVEILKFSLIALLIVVPIRFFIAQPFVVSGASMSPAFEDGEYLVIDQLSYRFNEPQRGDVVIFRYPRDPRTYFIKRIVGLPGESLEMSGKTLYVRNDENPDGFALSEPYIAKENEQGNFFSVTLADDEYFVLGDNRAASSDSRVWGPLNEQYLIGRSFLRLIPLTHIGILPGDYRNAYTQ